MIQLRQPYVLFLGDAPDQLAAKTADGIARWRPDLCVGQLRLPGCKADIGLPDMTIKEARAAGAQTLIAGVANRGGILSDAWRDTLLQAVGLGCDIASGLHGRLSAIPELAERAVKQGTQLHDVRYSDQVFPIANGTKRSGKRLLTVGTDCSVGKMYTALSMEREIRARGMKATFRASGQTGIFIAGQGLCIDAIISDFIAGAAEVLSPDNDADHWDLVEGQGSLFHASYAGVSLGLLHGSQPDALVLCHDPDRDHMRGLPTYGLPAIDECIRLNESCARLTNPACRTIGIAVNTSKRSQADALNLLEELEQQTRLPCVDPMRQGAGRLVENLPL